MWLFTGDESGLIKVVDVVAKMTTLAKEEEERKNKKNSKETGAAATEEEEQMHNSDKKRRRSPEATKASRGKLHDALAKQSNSIVVCGNGNKNRSITHMTWVLFNDLPMMVVARKDGTINLIEIASQKTVKAFTEQEVVKDLVKKKNELPADSRSRIIGLEATSTHLLVCTSRGTLSWTPWTASKLMHLSKVPLGHNLDILRSHPISKNVFAVGGKERDLRVYDMNKILEGQQGASMSDPLLPSNIGLLYKAKNLGHDALDLQPKVWIRDIQFMDKADPTKIAVSTQYHQIRMYDFSTQQRRPIMNEEVGDKPILRIRQSHIKDHLLFSDSTNVVGVFSLKDRKVIGAYKGIAGCVQDIKVVQMPAEPGQQGEYVVATGSLDRRLNLHHYPHPEKPFDPKPISRFNMLQRLYCVEVDALDLENVDGPKTTGQQEADHDELWDALGVVEPKRKHVSKKLKK